MFVSSSSSAVLLVLFWLSTRLRVARYRPRPALLRLYSGSTRTPQAQTRLRVAHYRPRSRGSTPARLRLDSYFSGSARLGWRVVAPGRLYSGSTPALLRLYSYFSGSARLSVARYRLRPALLRLYSGSTRTFPAQLHSALTSQGGALSPPGPAAGPLRSAHSLPDQTQRSA